MGTDSHVWPTDSVNTPANWNNFEMTVRIRDQDTLDFRNAGGATYLRFQFTTGGVTLYDMPNWTSRGSRAALTAATWYRMRMQANGTNVKARFWLDGSGEPGTWDINATVTAVTGGKMDWNYAANISVDNVVVSTIGGGGDTTAPATVSNLATSSPTSSSLLLSWTAPGDDGSTGTATTYDLRYRTGGAVVTTNWAAATQVSGEPTPQVAGTNQSMTVSGLAASTAYYFGLETADEVPNWSAISNSPSGTTSAGSDTTPPATTSNLAAGSPTTTSLTLTWTAPGDDGTTGTATTYDVRYLTSGAVVTTNWASATQATGEPTPHSAGTGESFVVSGLSASTVYYFGLETADEVPNWSAISNSPSGTTSAGGVTNLLTNPGFETGSLTPWTTGTVSSADKHTGTYSVYLANARTEQDFTTTVGTTYKFTAWLKITTQTGTDWGGIYLEAEDVNWVSLSTTPLLTQSTYGTGWFQVGISFTATTTTSRVYAGYYGGAGNTETCYIDDLMAFVKPVNNTPPQITNVTLTPTSITDVPATQTFSVTANDPDGAVQNYVWQFGDGMRSFASSGSRAWA